MFKPDLLTEGDEVEGLFDKEQLRDGELILGIHELANETIKLCDVDQFELLGHIVLYGGNSLIKNFPQELERRISALYPKKRDAISVHAPEDRLYAGVQGGAVITGIDSFSSAWATKEEYEEHGPDRCV